MSKFGVALGACAVAAVLGCAGSGVRGAAVPAPSAGPAPASAVVATPVPAAPAPDSAAEARHRAARDSVEARRLVTLGMGDVQSNQDAEATAHFREALRLQPRLGPALAGLAVIEGHARHYQAALDLADSAVALGDTDQFLTNVRGRALGSLGRCPEAIALLLPFVRANPRWHQPTPELAYCLISMDRASEAVSVMQVAVRGEPRAAPLQFALIEALVRSGQPDSALAHVEYLTGLYPENGLWWAIRGRVLALKGRLTDARASFERGFKLRPGLVDSLSSMDRSAWEAVRNVGRR